MNWNDNRPVDPQLLEQLLNEQSAALELFAAQWTNVPEDCVQQAFLELVRRRKPLNNAVAWLYRVVRNRAISAARSEQRQRKHESAAAGLGKTWFEPARQGVVDEQCLTEALGSLDEKQREVIVARIWGGLSFEQIGQVVGASTSSAHRRYEAGLTSLRERLGLSWLTENQTTC